MQGCVICQEQQKAQCAESLKPHEISVRPWQIVAMDLFQVGRLHYMLVVDYDSKYPKVRKLKDFSSQEIINLTKQIFGEQGIPERLISDNDPHYSSTLFKQFSQEWGFKHNTSSRYPQSNGLAEHCVQAIKSAMQKIASSKPRLRYDVAMLMVHSYQPCNSITWQTTVQPKTCGKLTSKVPQQCNPKIKNSNPPVSKAVIPKVSI